METAEAKKDALIQSGRMLTVKELRAMWPISAQYLSRLTHHPDENTRIPCVMFGRKPMYPYDELMWWKEKHRFVPKKRGGKSHDNSAS